MKYKSLFDVWRVSCEKYGNSILFSDNKESHVITYKQAFKQVCFLADIFKTNGIERFDHVSLFAVNSPDWLILEQAVITLGAVCVSKSSEINVDELRYVYSNSDSTALITDNFDVIDNFLKTIPDFIKTVKFIVYTGNKDIGFKNEKIFSLKNLLLKLNDETQIKTEYEEQPDDIAYINYTSGTSSMPKGAMLPNIGMTYVIEELQTFNEIEQGKTFVVTFPLSSAGGKSFNLLCLSAGCRIVYTPYKEFYQTINKFQPDYLHCAPKIIQTMHSMFMDEVKKKGNVFKKIFNLSYCISKLMLSFERNNLYNGKFLFMASPINFIKRLLENKIYKPIRNIMLKDDMVIFVGSAHLAKALEDFLQIMNINHIQHFGLTETTGLDVSNTLESQKMHPYTVGVAFSKTVIRIINPETGEELPKGEVGLITLQGPEILKGYYNNEEATKKALLKDNFLNTGDLGYVNQDGYLTVLSRYDDVIVLSNGYNVYTPLLENETKDSEYVYQLVIVGHGKPYLSALVVLNKKEYKNWCNSNNISGNIDPNKNEKFKEFLTEHLNEKIKRKNEHKYYEKLKKIYFLKEEFTEENGMLTPTLKIKYKKIVNKYKDIIDSLYIAEVK